MGEVADIIGGGTPSTSNSEFWDGDIDWYTPAEIGEQIYVDGSERKITQLGLDKSSATLLPANKTILFTSRAGIGKTAILRSDATTNQGFQSIVVDNNTEPYFIFSMTDKIKNKAISVASGSTFAEISSRALGQLEFMFPSINEQKAIGTFFSTLDQHITLHQRKLDKLKNVKQAYLSEMFPAEGERVPKRRFPGFTDAWEQRKLGEVGEIERESVNPKLSPNNIFEEYSMPSFDVDRRPAYVLGKDMLSSRLKIQRSSLLINKLNVRQQRIWLVETPSENAICSSEFMPFVSEMVNLEFLREFFLSNETTKKLEELSTGTSNSQNRVSPKDIINFKLAIPTLPEQEAIGTFFSTLDRHITLHQRKSI